MHDDFERRVRAAATAGWWVLLVAVALLTWSWLAYLFVMSNKPAWMQSLWGPDVSWELMQTVWLWAMAILKVGMWLMLLVVLWLTLWARQMRKPESRPTIHRDAVEARR
jgi:hypothetical protein